MDAKSSSCSPLRSATALLFCRTCQAVYRQPKLLPCLHSFCKPCLADMVTSSEDRAVIVCPLCAHTTKLPLTGVAGVPDNCFLTRMCQEYMAEVQSHIVARSLYSTSNRSSSEFTELRSKLTEELSHRTHSPPSAHLSQYGTQSVQGDSLPDSSMSDSGSASEQSTAKTLEAIHKMGRLQSKIMSLQGEALRVTYAIDQVNQCMIEWHQHKDDLKRAVQRRSSQFQFFIKRMEHQLMSQIDGKHVDDEFYTESDKSKMQLRNILKKILHEVGVLKNIQELGNEDDINMLSSDLLGKSVAMTDVMLDKFHFEMDVPTQSIEEIVADYFGEIRLNPQKVNVFAPEILDFTQISMGDVSEDREVISPFYDEGRETPILEDNELERCPSQKSSQRSFSDSSSIRYNDESLDKEDVRDHLVQFQNARETLRTRRKEILVLGQQAREDASSPLRDESRRRQRTAMRKGRVQSLDRIAAPITKKSSRTGLPSSATEQDRKTYQGAVSEVQPGLVINFKNVAGTSKFMHRSIPDDIHVPSPVIEEVSLLSTPQRILVKQTSDPHSIPGMLSSLEESSSEAALPSHSQSVMDHLSNNANDGGLFTGRRHSSDHYTLGSHGKGAPLDILNDRNPMRLVRRAISTVSDRKTKIDFLRENWQKRKEILIQTEGFVSPDNVAKHVTKSASHVLPHTISGSQSSIEETVSTAEIEDQEHPSSDDPNFGHIEALSDYNDELLKQDKICKDDVKTYSLLSPSRQISDPLTHGSFQDTSVNHEDVRHTSVSSRYPVSQTASAQSSQPRVISVSSPQQQVASTSLAQATTATTTPSIIPTTSTSRYSRYQTKPTESIDVSSLIAAMYSGKEKSIIHTTTTQMQNGSASTTQANTNTINGAATTRSTGGADHTTFSVEASQKTPNLTSHEHQTNITISSALIQPVSLESGVALHYPYVGSRYNEGLNRRHTIEGGQTAIQDTAKLTFTEKSKGNYDIPAYNSSQSRSFDHSRSPGSSDQSETPQLPLAEAINIDKIKGATIAHKRTVDTTKRIPSPLQLLQDRTISHRSTTPELPTALASHSSTSPSPSSSPTPPSPNPSDGTQKGRLREIARKKKERWRHLTIH